MCVCVYRKKVWLVSNIYIYRENNAEHDRTSLKKKEYELKYSVKSERTE